MFLTFNNIIDAKDERLILNENIELKKIINGTSFLFEDRTISSSEYLVDKFEGKGAYTYKGKNWKVLTFIPKSYLSLEYVINNLLYFLVISILIFAIACFVFYKIAQNIAIRINSLKDQINLLSNGIFLNIEEDKQADEIGGITLSLRNMVSNLKSTAEFVLKSSDDFLGKSLLDMRSNLQRVADNDKKKDLD